MSPDELRALADALEPMAQAPRFDGIDIPALCDYLRAQADAQPVAWIAHNLTTGHVKWTTDRCRAHGWIQGGNLRVKSLYTRPAPAAPQAEPCIGNDPTCPCQDGDACHYRDAADGTKGWPVPQAEPKRKPLPGLAPTHRCPACGAFWRQCDDFSFNLRAARCCDACNNAPVGGQLFALTTPVAMPRPSEPTEAQIEAGVRALSTHWHDSQSMSIAREESAIVLRAALAAKDNGNAGE